MSTAYSFFATAPGLKLAFRKRVLKPGSAIGYHLQKDDEIYYMLSNSVYSKTAKRNYRHSFSSFVILLQTFFMRWQEYISSDPGILFGKPVIKGTRIPIDLILEKLAAGYSNNDLLEAYPRLTIESIRACLLFAADSAKHEKVLALS